MLQHNLHTCTLSILCPRFIAWVYCLNLGMCDAHYVLLQLCHN